MNLVVHRAHVMHRQRCLVVALLVFSQVGREAHAQQAAVDVDTQSREADLFGSQSTEPEAKPASARDVSESDDNARLSENIGQEPADQSVGVREEPLTVGGVLYLRSVVTVDANTAAKNWRLSLPALLDTYLDARPNDRVRGFALGRLTLDATETQGLTAADPRVLLDQLWMRFDIGRAVFVTAGKQHVKWGTGHFWNPTDFLHSVERNPLAQFDERTGATMLKLHVPWEALGWNFYGIAAFDSDGIASKVSAVVGAGRAEMVLGTAEIGLDVVVRDGRQTRFGADLSFGVGLFDVYAESALTTARDTRWREDEGVCCLLKRDKAFSPSVVAGVSLSQKYNDEDSLTIGVEAFYNSVGYENADIYPLALGSGQLVPFYAGQRYAGLYVLLPSPGAWNDATFVVSSLANLTDRSYLTRLDYQITVLTHLRVEAFGAVHFGHKGGEFRFSLSLPSSETTGQGATVIQAPVFEGGLAVQMSM